MTSARASSSRHCLRLGDRRDYQIHNLTSHRRGLAEKRCEARRSDTISPFVGANPGGRSHAKCVTTGEKKTSLPISVPEASPSLPRSIPLSGRADQGQYLRDLRPSRCVTDGSGAAPGPALRRRIRHHRSFVYNPACGYQEETTVRRRFLPLFSSFQLPVPDEAVKMDELGGVVGTEKRCVSTRNVLEKICRPDIALRTTHQTARGCDRDRRADSRTSTTGQQL